MKRDLAKRDLAPWLLLPSVVLALSAVSVLAPRQSAHAAPPAPQNAAAAPKGAAYDDGDGDELLEHWGNPKYSHEARTQLAGIAVGFLALSTVAASTRARRIRRSDVVPMPTEAEFLKRSPSSAASTTDHRKAA